MQARTSSSSPRQSDGRKRAALRTGSSATVATKRSVRSSTGSKRAPANKGATGRARDNDATPRSVSQKRKKKTPRRNAAHSKPEHLSPRLKGTSGIRASGASSSTRTSARDGRRASPKRKYSRKAAEKVGQAMHEMKRGELRRGRSGKKVTSRKQAIAIGLSEARREGAKIPEPQSKSRTRRPSRTRRNLTSR